MTGNIKKFFLSGDRTVDVLSNTGHLFILSGIYMYSPWLCLAWIGYMATNMSQQLFFINQRKLANAVMAASAARVSEPEDKEKKHGQYV